MITGDGIASLARAFFYAGTPSVIVSVWNVADQPTSRLLPAFYRHWLSGADKASAVTERVVEAKGGRPDLGEASIVVSGGRGVGSAENFALVEEFFKSFANKCQCNVHIDLIRGRNGHHAAEAAFKAFAIAVREAKQVVGSEVPSTKGVI